MNRLLLINFAATWILVMNAFGQTSAPDKSPSGLRKNAIHISGGTALVYASFTGYIDHLLFDSEGKKYQAMFMRVGYGQYGQIASDGGYHVLTQAVIVRGRNNGHFEGGLGVAFVDPEDEGDSRGPLEPAISVGYRWQKREGNFLFRTGLAYPESLYLGIGFCL